MRIGNFLSALASRALAAWNWASNGRVVSKRSGKLSSTPMRRRSLKNTGRKPNGSQTSATSPVPQQSMLFAEGSRANPTPSRESAAEKTMLGIFGQRCFVSSEKQAHDLLSQKMSLEFSTPDMPPKSWLPLRKSHIARPLSKSLLVRLEPHTHESECSSWPTPSASDAGHGVNWNEARTILAGGRKRKNGSHRIQINLRVATAMREIADGRERKSGGQPNPELSEWLMGFPLSWTALDASAMQSLRKPRKKSEKRS